MFESSYKKPQYHINCAPSILSGTVLISFRTTLFKYIQYLYYFYDKASNVIYVLNTVHVLIMQQNYSSCCNILLKF